MNINLTGYAALALAVIALFATIRILAGTPPTRRILAFVCFSALAIPSVLVAVYYLHIMPETGTFYEFRSWRGSEFLIIFAGIAGGAAISLLPRLALIPILFCIAVLGIMPYIKPTVGPLDFSLLQDDWRNDTCLQSTASTCGPASICTILRRFGIDATEREAALASFSCAGGTEAWYLARFVRKSGLQAEFLLAGEIDYARELPVLAGVKIGGMGHFIAILDSDTQKITYSDPMTGMFTITHEEFAARYNFTGFRMRVHNGKQNI